MIEDGLQLIPRTTYDHRRLKAVHVRKYLHCFFVSG
jgi:hypothetical protein